MLSVIGSLIGMAYLENRLGFSKNLTGSESAMLVGCVYKDELKFMIIIIIEFEYRRFVINVNIIIK